MRDEAHLLDRLLTDPAAIAEVSRDEAARLLTAMSNLQCVLVARVLATPAAIRVEPPVLEDRLLTPAEAAARLVVTVRWLYRHADHLSYTRRLSPRTLRFSEAGMVREMGPKNALNKARSYA